MRKNIYVKDEDVSVFEEAEQLAGNDESLSSIIAATLRQYVEQKKSEEEIVLEVGRWPAKGASDTFKVSFKGRLLAEGTVLSGQTGSRDDRGTDWAIYQTEKGKFLIWWKDWSRWENESDIADYAIISALPERGTTFIGAETENVSSKIPGDVVAEAAAKAGQSNVKHLDI